MIRWWCRVVGALSLLLGAVNVLFVLAFPSSIAEGLPYAPNADTTRAFSDAWVLFALDMVGEGAMLLWASRTPSALIGAVWFAVVLELLHGVIGDALWMSRGYDVTSYLPFLCVHGLVVVTGAWLALREMQVLGPFRFSVRAAGS